MEKAKSNDWIIGQIKCGSWAVQNTVKFDVRRVMEESKELYAKFNFVDYQLLLLTNLQTKVKSTHSFEIYI